MTILDGEANDGQGNTNAGAGEQGNQNGDEGKADEGKADEGKADEGKADEGKADEGKADEGKEIDGAPEKYGDFATPKDFEASEVEATEFTDLAKKLNLTQANAQTMLDFVISKVQGLGEKHQDAWKDVRENWVTELKTDKEYGGLKFNETVERANRALLKYGSKEWSGWLKSSGFGDNSGLVKMLAKVDKATGEGGIIDGNPPGGEGQSLAETMYPNQGKS